MTEETAGSRTACLLPFLQKGVTQIAWVVRDLEESVRSFHALLGVGPWHFYKYGRPLLSMMRRNGRDAEYAMDTAVTNAGVTRLELIQPLEGDTVFHEFVNRKGYGRIHHLGLAVENMEESLAVVRTGGIDVLMEGGGYGLDGDGHFAFLDTEGLVGTMLELMQRPKRRHEPYRVFPTP